MKKALLKKMAINAKKAKDDLDHQMALTARAFHKQVLVLLVVFLVAASGLASQISTRHF